MILFTIFQLAKCVEIHPQFGLAFMQHNRDVEFISSYVNIAWSRVINNPCDVINITELIAQYPCKHNSDEHEIHVNNKYAVVLSKFKHNCYREWAYLFDEINDVSISKRKKRGVFAALLGVTSIVGNLVNIGSVMHQFFTPKIDNMVKINEQIIQIGTMFLAVDKKLDIVSMKLCESIFDTNERLYETIISNYVTGYVQQIELEVGELSVSRLPSSIKFHTELAQVCDRIDSNDLNYCNKLIGSDLISVKFAGVALSGSALNMFLDIKIAVRDAKPTQNTLLSITNRGFFRNKKYYRVQLPNYVIQMSNMTLVVDEQHCSTNMEICDINALSKDACTKSILNSGSVLNCSIQQQISNNNCHYAKVPGGHIVVANEAIFIPSNTILENNKITFNNTNIFLNTSGNLLCNNRIYNLNNDPIKIQTLAFIPSPPKLFYDNMTNVFETNKIIQSMTIRINQSIEDLINSDDHLAFGQMQIHTLIIILVANFCSIIAISAIFLLAYRRFTNRKKIVRYDTKTGRLSYPRQFNPQLDNFSICEKADIPPIRSTLC